LLTVFGATSPIVPMNSRTLGGRRHIRIGIVRTRVDAADRHAQHVGALRQPRVADQSFLVEEFAEAEASARRRRG